MPHGRRALRALWHWLARHRRMLLWLAAVALVFYLIGRYTSPVLMPDACKIYG